MAARSPAPPPPITKTSWTGPASPAMVGANLRPGRLVVVPDHVNLRTAVVVLVVDPATAAVVVLIAKEQAVVVPVLVMIAGHGLAAGCPFRHEMRLCANHRYLP